MNRYLGIVLATIASLLTVGALRADDAALLPNAIQYFMDANGRPLANGKVYFYTPSTTTAKTTWTSADKATPQANPVQLGVSGRPTNPIYGDGTYRQIVKDANNNTIWDFNTASTGSGGGITSMSSLAWTTMVSVARTPRTFRPSASTNIARPPRSSSRRVTPTTATARRTHSLPNVMPRRPRAPRGNTIVCATR